MWNWIKTFIPINKILIGLAIGAGLYIGYLEIRVAWLKDDNASLEQTNDNLTKTVATRDATIKILAAREAKLKAISDDKQKTIDHLNGLPSGSVSPALRFAVDHDGVR